MSKKLIGELRQKTGISENTILKVLAGLNGHSSTEIRSMVEAAEVDVQEPTLEEAVAKGSESITSTSSTTPTPKTSSKATKKTKTT